MRFHNLDLNLLVALDVLLTEANVTRAAEKLHMSQTTMSGALGRLRQHFRDDLLVQSGRRMILTPFAEGLRAPVQSILMQAETVALKRTDFNPAQATGEFAILALDAVHAVFTSRLSQHIARVAPGISLSFVHLMRSDDFARLERNDVQFMIVPGFSLIAGQPSVQLYDDSMVCICAADHPIISDALSLESYLAAKHVVPQMNALDGFESHDATALRMMGHRRYIGISTTSYVLMPSLVVGTPYLATIPRRLALQAAQSLPLRLFKLPFTTPPITEMIQWHRSFDNDPAIRWLRQQMVQVATQL